MATRTIGLALIICGVGCASSPSTRSSVGPPERPDLRVYVGTSETGDDTDRRGRLQSVMDVRLMLGSRHEHLVLVHSPAEADIAVAILERVVADSKGSLSLFPPRYYAGRNIVRLHSTVTRDGESVDLVGARWREDNAEG